MTIGLCQCTGPIECAVLALLLDAYTRLLMPAALVTSSYASI